MITLPLADADSMEHYLTDRVADALGLALTDDNEYAALPLAAAVWSLTDAGSPLASGLRTEHGCAWLGGIAAAVSFGDETDFLDPHSVADDLVAQFDADAAVGLVFHFDLRSWGRVDDSTPLTLAEFAYAALTDQTVHLVEALARTAGVELS